MISSAAVVGMVLLWLAAGAKLVLSRRTAAGGGVRMLCFALLMLAGSMTADLDALYLPLDRALGSVNVASLLVYGQAMASVWAFYMVLDRFLARSLSGPAGSSRRGYVELASALAATVVLFWLGPARQPDVPKLDAHPYTSVGTAMWFVVVIGAGSYFTMRAVIGAARSALYAGRTGKPTVAVGLWLIALGGILGVINNSFQIFVASAVSTPLGTTVSNVLTAAGFCAAGSVAIGVTLPAAQWWMTSGSWARPLQQRWAFAALHPLWRDLLTVAPDVALDTRRGPTTGLLAVRDAKYQLYRRVIEIRDAALAVRPYTDPGTWSYAHQSAQHRGLAGNALLADTEAAVLAQGIASAMNDTRPQDNLGCDPGRQPGPDQGPFEGGLTEAEHGSSLAEEVDWLLAVARCYRRHKTDIRYPPAA